MSLNPLRKLRDNLKAFDVDVEVLAIVITHKTILADLQASQLAQGRNSMGQPIYPLYSPFTIEKKQKEGVGLGRVTSYVTFFSTGQLYGSLFAEINGRKFSIKSGSFKFGKMIDRSGISVVGLNQESKIHFIESYFLPDFKKIFNTRTGLSLS